jgi:hypothetical protein
MAGEVTENEAVVDRDSEGQNGARNRSTISFPYGSLKDAEEIAQALHDWGGEATPDQLAGALDTTARSGTFRMKVATSKTFGAIHVSRGKIALAERGKRLIDPEKRDAARVEAFLAVPLFDAIHEAFKGGDLPSDALLERKMADLGVSPKQTSKARQALQRSAERAGFFKTKKGRLIQPADSTKSESESRKETNVNATQAGAVAVPLADLWLTLLDKGERWSAEETQDYVEAARKLRKILSGNA